MRERIQKRTKYLTASAMLSALGVVLLGIGALVEVLDVTTAIAASFLIIYAVIELGGVYPWLIWLVTSSLALILLPQKTPALFYALFAGFYPIVKEKLERLKSVLSYPLKLLVLHLSLGGIVLVTRLFFPGLLETDGLWWMPLLLYVACLLCFVVYDIALTRLISYYLIKLQKRFRIK
jgi:hypothetical protein